MRRREFILRALGTISGATLASTACSIQKNGLSSANQLNVYSWADYLHPDAIPEFEKRYGVRVVYDTFSSNEGLLARLQAGASNYDIIVPTSFMVKQLRQLGSLAVLDHDRLPMLKNIMPRFRNPKFDPHLEHSVPYTWGTTGIGFNTAQFRSRKAWPADWDVFWDKRFAHRMTLLDDARETIGMSLKRLGDSYNCIDHSKILGAVGALKLQKPLTMCYTLDQGIVQLSAEDSWLSLIYSGDASQAARANANVGYVLPTSGASIFLDSLCIPVTAPHVENAYRWINFMLEPRIAAATASYTRYATPNAEAFKLLQKEIIEDRNLYPSEAVMSKCEEIADIGQEIFFYDKMWTELKCT